MATRGAAPPPTSSATDDAPVPKRLPPPQCRRSARACRGADGHDAEDLLATTWPTTTATTSSRRPGAADRRERPGLRPLPAGRGARKGFKGLVTTMGAGALTLANQYQPSAITLDMHLPDMDGWRVLDRSSTTRRCATSRCVISTDDSKDRAFKSRRAGVPGKADPVQGSAGRHAGEAAGLRVAQRAPAGGDGQPARCATTGCWRSSEQIDVTVVASSQQLPAGAGRGPLRLPWCSTTVRRRRHRATAAGDRAPGRIGPMPLILYRRRKRALHAWHSDDG
jgi:CheY-like chemotaxis protein